MSIRIWVTSPQILHKQSTQFVIKNTLYSLLRTPQEMIRYVENFILVGKKKVLPPSTVSEGRTTMRNADVATMMAHKVSKRSTSHSYAMKVWKKRLASTSTSSRFLFLNCETFSNARIVIAPEIVSPKLFTMGAFVVPFIRMSSRAEVR